MDRATTTADLEHRFGFHPTNPVTGPVHDHVRARCLDLAEDLGEQLPAGREKSLALTKLEEVMFWANAAVARSDMGSPVRQPIDT